MSTISRIEMHRHADISTSGQEVWELLADWAGMPCWWLSVERGGPPGPGLLRCELVGSHNAIPRTRRMTLDNGAIAEEELFYQNDQTRRISRPQSDRRDARRLCPNLHIDTLKQKIRDSR